MAGHKQCPVQQTVPVEVKQCKQKKIRTKQVRNNNNNNNGLFTVYPLQTEWLFTCKIIYIILNIQ
jgi:hypothetical protein